MIRIRRYRVFLFVAVVSLVGVYYFSQDAPWDAAELRGFSLHRPHKSDDLDTNSGTGHEVDDGPIQENQDSLINPQVPGDDYPPVKYTLLDAGTPEDQAAQKAGHPPSKIIPGFSADNFNAVPDNDEVKAKHWVKPSQLFPVPTESVIQLPTGAPKAIPRVQHQFSTNGPRADEEKLAAVKRAMERTWNGYKTYAWMHDELRPKSNRTKDPFMGWAATLVDSLDTLHIMGMEKEFEEAVHATANIDFTTSSRMDIPVFETTIRYLGGLIGAHDVGGGKYPILLQKAVELAEVLVGAFDTPNRMPVLYYNWWPSMTAVQHRASSGAVLAEIGSLSLEFTRLAQLTKEPKYYDAVARVTNALQLSQNTTTVPGLWPQYVDAAGCQGSTQYAHSLSKGPPKGVSILPPTRASIKAETDLKDSKMTNTNKIVADHYPEKDKSSFGDDVKGFSKRQTESDIPLEDLKKCGISQTNSGKFTLGAMADSTYEYLPKMHLLLGGLTDQYQSMYELAMKAINEHLLYRPMVKDDRDLLFAASFTTTAGGQQDEERETVEGSRDATTGHLTCFLGGMVGLGAKIFDRQDDVNKAKKLSDGCVWAYESTASGIMPEEFTPLMCDAIDSCPWNETRYWEALDPNPEARIAISQPTYVYTSPSQKGSGASLNQKGSGTSLNQRQFDGYLDTSADAVPKVPSQLGSAQSGTHEAPQTLKKLPPGAAISSLPHEEYVLHKIETGNIPAGFVSIPHKHYILRPEAIESVFYMYRITGDEVWRQKGWTMFQAVERETQTFSGASAIENVLIKGSDKSDSMESFWSAETLKYYYLLFSDPDLISLDDFVLNTEAHPLLRPDAKRP